MKSLPIDDLQRLWHEAESIGYGNLEQAWKKIVRDLAAMLDCPGGGCATLFHRDAPNSGIYGGWQLVCSLDEGADYATRNSIERAWSARSEAARAACIQMLFESAGTLRVMSALAIESHVFRSVEEPDDHLIERHGYSDRIIGVYALGPSTEVHIHFDRRVDQRPFDEAARVLFEVALAGLGRLCRWLALSYGVNSEGNPLSARDRELLNVLLQGSSEKQIAAQMGLTPGSLHQRVVRLYRRFGVSGRAEFMALWLAPNVERRSIGAQ